MTGAPATTFASLALLAAAIAVVLMGLVGDPLALRWGRDELLAAVAWVAAPGVVLALLAGSRWWPPAALLVVLAGMAVSFGPAAIATGSLVIVASYALGSLLLSRDPARPLEHGLLAGVLGLGLISTIISWTVRATIHFDFVYALILAVLIAIRRKACIQLLRDCGALFASRRVDAANLPDRLVGSLLIALLLYAAGSGAIPESGYDAMTSHYALLHKLKAHGAWSYDFTELRFTLMPKLAVWAHAPFFIVGGEMAMRAVNLLAVAAIGGLVASRLTSMLPRWHAGLMAASFLSLPLTVWMTTMLSEDPVATLFFTASAVAFLRMWDRPGDTEWLYAGLALLGMAAAAKAQLLFGGGLGAAFVIAILARRPSIESVGAIAGASLVFFTLAAFPYLQAFALTGNPFYPIDPELAVDPRWSGKLSWALPYDFTFRTSEHLESYAGAVGLFPVLGVAAFLCALFFTRLAVVRILGAVLALFVAGLLIQSQYVRYFFYVVPAMVLCIGMFLAQAPYVTRWSVAGLAVVLILSNVALMRSTPTPALNLSALLWPQAAASAPAERRLYAALNAIGEPVRIFVAGRTGFVAGLDGRVDAPGWYGEPQVAERLNGARSMKRFLELAREVGVTHVSAIGGFASPLMERICRRVCEPALQVGALGDQFFRLRYPRRPIGAMAGFKYGPVSLLDGPLETRFLAKGWSNERYPGARSQSLEAGLRIPRRLNGRSIDRLVFELSMVNAVAWRHEAPPQMEIIIDGKVVDVFEFGQAGMFPLTIYFDGENESDTVRRIVAPYPSVSDDMEVVIRLRAVGVGAPEPRANGDHPVAFILKYLILETEF